jgi:hypothetical protein
MKYQILPETQSIDGVPVYRIQALIDNPTFSVKAGDKGGWLQSELNLSQDGPCWVADESVVMGEAFIDQCAFVGGSQIINEKTIISGMCILAG